MGSAGFFGWKVRKVIVAVVLIVCAVIAQPLSAYTGNPALSPVSEAFTPTSSASFQGGVVGVYNLTESVTVNGVVTTRGYIRLLSLGQASLTLQGKGSLGVDTPVTESATWVFPASMVQNLTRAAVVVHTLDAMSYPPSYDGYGLQEFANIVLRPSANVTSNGVFVAQEWSGSQTVTFVQSGTLSGLFVISNANITDNMGKTAPATITGALPVSVEVGSQDATAIVRLTDWAVTLTFAVLLLVLVELDRRDHGSAAVREQPET